MITDDADLQPSDPIATNPDFYNVMWENDDVRVLEYRDEPGEQTTPHTHPNTVMIALTDFERRLSLGPVERDVALSAGSAQWLPAQSHSGKNIGSTPTHTILVELKHSQQQSPASGDIGPTSPPAV